MVYAWVVRVENASDVVYHIDYSAGLFSEWDSPNVNGLTPPYIILPGFTSTSVEDFAIPHSGTLSISCENDDSTKIEVFIGPRPGQTSVDAEDWLQFRTPDGKPVGIRNWKCMGKSQMIGGSHVNLELKFTGSLKNGIEGAVNLRSVSLNQPEDVLVNVYDLASQLSSFNALFSNKSYNLFGFFHAGIEVYGEEWSFYRAPDDTCGICRSRRPKTHSVHVFRESINLGSTKLSSSEVRQLLLSKFRCEWRGNAYDLLEKNCLTFCNAFAKDLGVGECPSWISNLHLSACSISSYLPWLKSYITGEIEDELGDTREGNVESRISNGIFRS